MRFAGRLGFGEDEAFRLRKDWERGRREQMVLVKVERRLESDLKGLREDLNKEMGVRDGLIQKNNALEREVANLRSEVEKGRRGLSIEKERNTWFEGKAFELERAIQEWERRSNDQLAKIREFQSTP